MSLTQELIKDWKASVLGAAPTSASRASVEIRAKIQESAAAGKFPDVCEDIDFEKIMHECLPKETTDFLRQNVPVNAQTSQLWESSLGVLTTNHFADLLGPLIVVGMWQECAQAPLVLSGIIPTVPAGCQQTDFYGYHDIGDVVEENEAELEETEYKGIGSPTKVSQTVRRKKKFAFGITREALCRDPDGFFRNMMRRGGSALALHKEKLLVDTVYELFPTTGFFRPYIENNVRWKTYYKASGAPWVNLIVGNDLDGTYLPFDVLEQQTEGMVSPFTGEPITCDFRQIMTSNANQAARARQGLYPIQVDFDLNAPDFAGLNARASYGREGYSQYTILPQDRYVISRLKTWYDDVAGLDAADAQDAARKTWIVGDLARAFKWSEEWPVETLERVGPNTREYFDQEIVWQIKFMTKADPMVADPRAVIKFVPDITGYASYVSYVWA